MSPPSPLVAINLIVQHIQDIVNGGLTKRQNGYVNGYITPRKRQPSERERVGERESVWVYE